MKPLLHAARRGNWPHSGYAYPVDATVSNVTKHHITFRIPTRSGRIVTRSVRAENIRIPARQENTL